MEQEQDYDFERFFCFPSPAPAERVFRVTIDGGTIRFDPETADKLGVRDLRLARLTFKDHTVVIQPLTPPARGAARVHRCLRSTSVLARAFFRTTRHAPKGRRRYFCTKDAEGRIVIDLRLRIPVGRPKSW